MNVVVATAEYDRWLAQRLRVIVKRDLRRKHREMSEDPFSFLRATFYRWAQVWPLAKGAPRQRQRRSRAPRGWPRQSNDCLDFDADGQAVTAAAEDDPPKG